MYPVQLMTAKAEEIEIPLKEVYRYMGYQRQIEPDEEVLIALKSVLDELASKVSYKTSFTRLPIKFLAEDVLDIGFTKVKSRALGKNLKNCEEIFLFLATVGSDIDRQVKRYEKSRPSLALMWNAVGTGAVEAWCDEVCARLEKIVEAEGLFLRPRFSPGYGDFALEHQRAILPVLDSYRRAGVTLTDKLLMVPTKSVTAVVGITNQSRCGNVSACLACEKTDCGFRSL